MSLQIEQPVAPMMEPVEAPVMDAEEPVMEDLPVKDLEAQVKDDETATAAETEVEDPIEVQATQQASCFDFSLMCCNFGAVPPK